MSTLIRLGCILCLALALPWSTADARQYFYELYAGNEVNTVVRDISTDGQYLVGEAWRNGEPFYAFTYSLEDGFLLIKGGLAHDVSCNGRTVAGSVTIDGTRYAATWTAETGWVRLAGAATPADSEATDISCDGSVVVGHVDYLANDPRAFAWKSNLGMVQLGVDPGFVRSKVADLSGNGRSLILRTTYTSGVLSQNWDPYTMNLGHPPVYDASLGMPLAVSGDGTGVLFLRGNDMYYVRNGVSTSAGALEGLFEGMDDNGRTIVSWKGGLAISPYDEEAWIRTASRGAEAMVDYLNSFPDIELPDGLHLNSASVDSTGSVIAGTARYGEATIYPAFAWITTSRYTVPNRSVRVWTPPTTCELEWNCDGIVDFKDVYAGKNKGGFYEDVRYFTEYADDYFEYVDGGYFHKQQCGEPADLDWDRNGRIEMIDAYAGSPSPRNLESFYTQWYVYNSYPQDYSYWYPDSECVPGPTCENNPCGPYALCDDTSGEIECTCMADRERIDGECSSSSRDESPVVEILDAAGSVVGYGVAIDEDTILTTHTVGGNSNYSVRTESGQVIRVWSVTGHPNFNEGSGYLPNDVEVIRLTSAISGVIPAQIAPVSATNNEAIVWTTEVYLDNRLNADASSHNFIARDDLCSDSHGTSFNEEVHLCVVQAEMPFDEPIPDGLNEGSPIFATSDTDGDSSRRMLVGLFSWHNGSDKPIVATRLSRYQMWISSLASWQPPAD